MFHVTSKRNIWFAILVNNKQARTATAYIIPPLRTLNAIHVSRHLLEKYMVRYIAILVNNKQARTATAYILPPLRTLNTIHVSRHLQGKSMVRYSCKQ